MTSRAGQEGDFERWLAVGNEWKKLWEASEEWLNGQGEIKDWKA